MNLCFHHEIRIYKGWEYILKHFCICESYKQLLLSAALTFLEYLFFTIFLLAKIRMIVIFLATFWISLQRLEKLNFSKSNVNYYIICDNTTIHKSNLTKNFDKKVFEK